MSQLEALLSRYDYSLPSQSIASEPASPRDSSKLLIFDRALQTISFDTYRNLDRHLPPNSLLIFNETKVIPARLSGRIATGGKAELLCTHMGEREILALCERRLAPGQTVTLGKDITLIVGKKVGKEYHISLPPGFNVRAYMHRHGVTPLPPYLKHSKLTERDRRRKYQTVFAKNDGSIAAPTASLHFTRRLFRKLKRRGIEIAFITLHVNLGTFMPLTEENVLSGKLHEETYEIPTSVVDAIRRAKKQGRPIIPVGTTALRALESAYASSKLRRSGTTRLFIREGYTFKIADGLITNFHVPRSSLMMLVAALVGRERLLKLYEIAKKRHFRFFSFGDGMLIR